MTRMPRTLCLLGPLTFAMLMSACHDGGPTPRALPYTARSYDPPKECFPTNASDLPPRGVVIVPGLLPCPCVVDRIAGDTVDCIELDAGLSRSFSLASRPRVLLLADNRAIVAPSAYNCSRPSWDRTPTPRPTPSPTATPTDLDRKLQIELTRVQSIHVPQSQRLATLKLVTKLGRIFASMEDYASEADRDAILRKDSDRYDDAIVDATGEVPGPVIAYVEEVYRAVLAALRGGDIATTNQAAAMRAAMKTLGSH